MSPPNPFKRLRERVLDRRVDRQIARVEVFLGEIEDGPQNEPPVLFFNASTRIHRLSLNGAYSLLSSWIMRANGQPVRHLVCHRGMAQCILGSNNLKPAAQPPCHRCMGVSERLYPPDLVIPLELDAPQVALIQRELKTHSLDTLFNWEYEGIPLGALVLPGLRWVMRRHNLEPNPTTLSLYRQYLSSSVSLVLRFDELLRQVRPKALVAFNGIFYPEAVLRHRARALGIPVITHEVGLQPFSAFFSHSEATFREINLEPGKDLDAAQEEKLNHYLASRFQGDFSMAGIQFWDSMSDLPDHIHERQASFSAVVPVFTNVVFDTSQMHANTLFRDMFAWLDELRLVIEHHQDLLFIIRAHPDEDRAGKASCESVSAWVEDSGLEHLPNVVFISPEESISSYKLIELAKLVLVYNSSIGLEASILEKPVLCAGRARFSQAGTVMFPESSAHYWQKLEQLLLERDIKVPEEYSDNARKFLYQELFRASLDLSEFLEPDPTLPGMVLLRDFEPGELYASQALQTIYNGVIQGEDFTLPV